MLSELSIKNFAIIESLNVTLENGLNILSGETGAGKSILIDAINLLVGGKGSVEFIRHGTTKTEIEGLFLLDDPNHPIYEKASSLGIEIEDGMVILRREFSLSKKNVCRVNGKLVTIGILRELGSTLVDIHGQHEHQELMDDSLHLQLVDHYGGSKLEVAKKEYIHLFKQYEEKKKQLKHLSENDQLMAHRLDLITFQLKEIESAKLLPNEDEQLEEKKNRLVNFEKTYSLLNGVKESLTSDMRAIDWLSEAMDKLEEVSKLDPSYKELSETITNCYYQIEDVARTVSTNLNFAEYDPNELNVIVERLAEITQLKRKYGNTISDILNYAATIDEEIETITNKESNILKLQEEIHSLEQDLLVEAKLISEIRKNVALQLTDSIHRELKQLYMEKTVFEIKFTTNEMEFTSNGIDSVQFLISPNPGEPLKPLSRIASGGELSRMMLALKSIFSKHQGITSIVFDEVDTGVGGRVAQAIAEKIYKVSINSQVICISHLPQVAAMADHHLFISKHTKNNRTYSTLTVLNEEQKMDEISRMISGVQITDLTKKHAQELIDLAKKLKATN